MAREHTLSEERADGAVCGGAATPWRAVVRAWGVCARRVRCCGEKLRRAGCRGPHSNEREGATRGDCNVIRVIQLCVDADIVVEASNAASEGGGRPGADVDTADAVVGNLLRCIGREHTLSEERAGGAVWRAAAPP